MEEGNYSSFDALYKGYYKAGVIFLNSIVKDKYAAENMIQDVFLKIWLRKDKLEFNEELKSYIFTSLKNIAFDYLKKIRKDETFKQGYLESMKHFQNDEGGYDESYKRHIAAAVDSLTDRKKNIVKLNIEEGKSYKEIAALLFISKNSVKNHLIKAKQSLRKSIKYPYSV